MRLENHLIRLSSLSPLGEFLIAVTHFQVRASDPIFRFWKDVLYTQQCCDCFLVFLLLVETFADSVLSFRPDFILSPRRKICEYPNCFSIFPLALQNNAQPDHT